MADPLDDALGLPPMEVEKRVPIVPVEDTADVDYEYTRKNIYRALAKIEDAMDELAEVARISEHPRAYEVYANLAKTFIDANKDLLNARKLQAESQRGPSQTVHNHNTALVFSSEEMLTMIKNKMRETE